MAARFRFPPVEQAMRDPNGLLATGGDLSADTLLEAYRHGIFPWFGEQDPILWWSPDPRMVLYPAEVKISRSLAKILRRGEFELSLDRAFEQVMQGCATPRQDQQGSWILPEMIAAYSQLHQQGYAHSVEVWQQQQLVGGLYGVAIGRMFYGESMFSRVSNASKVALVSLCRQLQRWGFELIDCQMNTHHLASLGGREIMRHEFMQHLTKLSTKAAVQHWQFEPDLFV